MCTCSVIGRGSHWQKLLVGVSSPNAISVGERMKKSTLS